MIGVIPISSNAQRWKKYRMEVGAGIGPSFFLSDVGGYNEVPSNFIDDINFKATRYAVAGNFNYFLRQDMSVNGGLMYTMLSANDKFAGSEARRNRNFDIQTHVFEVSAMYRYYFVKEKFGHAFRLRGTSVPFFSSLAGYVTIGVAGFYFNPKGKAPGGSSYVSLQPIGTEGQGLPGNPEKYKRMSLAIPLGVGAKYALTTQWGVGAEFTFRKTFTDYLDDVSTVYYDRQALSDTYGGDAAKLADPNDGTNPTWTDPGEQRGSPKQNDFYMTFMFSATYKILKGKAFKPRF